MMDVLNIVVCGVGGQGILTLSRLLIEAAHAKGMDALASETHGLSQRGGTVIVHVRIGKEVYAPLIPKGMAHYILSTELMETVRYLEYANQDTIVITNSKIILPALPGIVKPISEDSVVEWLKQRINKLYVIPASRIAEEVGFPQATNMAMLGAITPFIKDYIDVEYLRTAIARVGRGRVGELNLQAFLKALEYMCREFGVCL